MDTIKKFFKAFWQEITNYLSPNNTYPIPSKPIEVKIISAEHWLVEAAINKAILEGWKPKWETVSSTLLLNPGKATTIVTIILTK